MATKTYQNQQLGAEEYIQDSYDKINENSDEVDADLDTAFAHVNNTADFHSASDIVNDSAVGGVTVDDALDNLEGLIDAISAADSNAQIGVYTLAGTGTDTITATFTGLVYFSGLKINLDGAGTNLTSSVSLNINGEGVKSIKFKKKDGTKVDLAPGQMPAIAQLEYDGTDFVLMNSGAAYYSAEATATAEITSLPSTGIESGELELEVRGNSLEQIVVNGNFADGSMVGLILTQF